jgi:hypothetical protein
VARLNHLWRAKNLIRTSNHQSRLKPVAGIILKPTSGSFQTVGFSHQPPNDSLQNMMVLATPANKRFSAKHDGFSSTSRQIIFFKTLWLQPKNNRRMVYLKTW